MMNLVCSIHIGRCMGDLGFWLNFKPPLCLHAFAVLSSSALAHISKKKKKMKKVLANSVDPDVCLLILLFFLVSIIAVFQDLYNTPF